MIKLQICLSVLKHLITKNLHLPLYEWYAVTIPLQVTNLTRKHHCEYTSVYGAY